MARLVLAIGIALSLHVLLLLMHVPGQRFESPEFIGTGQVTVSIVRSVPEPSKTRNIEPAEPVVSVEEEMTVLPEEDMPEAVIDPPLAEDEQIPVSQDAHEADKETTAAAVEPMVSQLYPPTVTQESEQGDETAEELIVPESPEEVSQGASDIESLRDPVPVAQLNRPPVYPALARKRGWEGTVLLEVDILADGMVQVISIRQSSSYGLLDQEAVEAVRKWHFQPGTRAGMPVAMKVLVPVHFLLQNQK